MKVLFICSQNKVRSPAAEAVFSMVPGLEVASAGTEADAEMPVSADLIEWADVVLVMEPRHRSRLQQIFGKTLRNKKLVVLGIPDRWDYPAPELMDTLRHRVSLHLRLTREQMAVLAGQSSD